MWPVAFEEGKTDQDLDKISRSLFSPAKSALGSYFAYKFNSDLNVHVFVVVDQAQFPEDARVKNDKLVIPSQYRNLAFVEVLLTKSSGGGWRIEIPKFSQFPPDVRVTLEIPLFGCKPDKKKQSTDSFSVSNVADDLIKKVVTQYIAALLPPRTTIQEVAPVPASAKSALDTMLASESSAGDRLRAAATLVDRVQAIATSSSRSGGLKRTADDAQPTAPVTSQVTIGSDQTPQQQDKPAVNPVPKDNSDVKDKATQESKDKPQQESKEKKAAPAAEAPKLSRPAAVVDDDEDDILAELEKSIQDLDVKQSTVVVAAVSGEKKRSAEKAKLAIVRLQAHASENGNFADLIKLILGSSVNFEIQNEPEHELGFFPPIPEPVMFFAVERAAKAYDVDLFAIARHLHRRVIYIKLVENGSKASVESDHFVLPVSLKDGVIVWKADRAHEVVLKKIRDRWAVITTRA